MSQRVDNAFDQALVQLGGLAMRSQPDALVQLGGAFAHDPGKAAEYVVHGHHAAGHHRSLKVARIALQLLYAVTQPVVQAEIGSESGRETVCQYVQTSVVAVSLKKT